MNAKIISLDIETACNVQTCAHFGSSRCPDKHSLSPWHGRITKLAMKWKPGHAVYDGLTEEAKKSVLAAIKNGYGFIGHSYKFDALWLIVHGMDMRTIIDSWVGDTQLMAFVHTKKIDPEWLYKHNQQRSKNTREMGNHSLKALAPYYGCTDGEAYWEADDHADDEYVLKDADYTLRLYHKLTAIMTADELAFVNSKLIPWTKMIMEAEVRGLKLDVAGLLKHQSELAHEITSLEAQLDVMWASGHQTYAAGMLADCNARYDAMKDTKAREPRRLKAIEKLPTKVSYDSPTQMRWLLGTHLGYDIASLEGAESTGKEVLNRLADDGNEDIATYTKWRKAQKIATAFIPSLLDLCDDNGCVHPIYNVTGARTGRLSCERPNAQQVPSSLKRFFKPIDGTLVGYDQAAIEAKLIAVFTEDPVLINTMLTGESIHNVNTKVFFELPHVATKDIPEKYGKQRKTSKNIGFALFYNAGGRRIQTTFTQGGFPIQLGHAKKIHKAFLSTYKVAMDYTKEVVSMLEKGETLTNLLGRPVKIQNAQDAYMTGFNTLIQGSASDINLDRMCEAVRECREQGIECYPLLSVHDYTGIEVIGDASVVAKADKTIRESLSALTFDTAYGKISLEVEGGISERWD